MRRSRDAECDSRGGGGGGTIALGASAGPASRQAPPTYSNNEREVKLAPLERHHHVDEEAAVEGFEVVVKPVGASAWRVSVKNNTDSVSSLLFDESSFVASTGMAAGRLINGNTRKIDSAKTQPPIPVPPGAAVTEWALPEKMITFEEQEEKFAEYTGRWVRASLGAAVDAEREKREKLLVGGKLFVTIQTASAKLTWRGVVVADPQPEKVEVCFLDVREESCYASAEACTQAQARAAARAAPKVIGTCETRK